MKILWIVNTVFDYPAEKLGISKTCYGGWMKSLYQELIKNNDISISIATAYNINKTQKYEDEKSVYYILASKNNKKYDSKLEKEWKKVIDEIKPDLIHIHGSEFAHSLPLMNINKKIPVVLSIQGLINMCSKVYFADISLKEIKKNITFRDIIRRDSIIKAKDKFTQRGILELELIKNVKNIIGRTTWDYANVKAVNLSLRYFKNNESLRKTFYNNEWNINNIKRNTIFFSQGTYPIKGLHIMLEALYIVKKQKPGIKLIVAGPNILERQTIKQKFKRTGYSKYLQGLINKYNLQDNTKFTGNLDENQMCNEYLKCNVFVQASAIENSPNSLGEAMILGVPCVASNVGGTSDMLTDKEEGFLYQYTETAMLANYILQILNDDDLAISLGKKARKKALVTHDRRKNVEDLIKIYNEILGRKNEEN